MKNIAERKVKSSGIKSSQLLLSVFMGVLYYFAGYTIDIPTVLFMVVLILIDMLFR